MREAPPAARGLEPGTRLTRLELTDHAGNTRRLADLVGGDPAVLHFYRGWWCPKEQAFFRRLLRLQREAEVAYTRFISISVGPWPVTAAFRAGLGRDGPSSPTRPARCSASSGCAETADTLNDPYVPAVATLSPDLTIRSFYDGYWFLGRPTEEELIHDLRAITREIRPDWEAPTP